jgi:hypothetical protein
MDIDALNLKEINTNITKIKFITNLPIENKDNLNDIFNNIQS